MCTVPESKYVCCREVSSQSRGGSVQVVELGGAGRNKQKEGESNVSGWYWLALTSQPVLSCKFKQVLLFLCFRTVFLLGYSALHLHDNTVLKHRLRCDNTGLKFKPMYSKCSFLPLGNYSLLDLILHKCNMIHTAPVSFPSYCGIIWL